jgi:hypothetical protein
MYLESESMVISQKHSPLFEGEGKEREKSWELSGILLCPLRQAVTDTHTQDG